MVTTLTFICALGCGLVAGVFFAFSTFVMQGLGRLPAPEGIAAMQSINVTAITPAFMTALFGTAAACLAAVVVAIAGDSEGGWLLAGGLLYVIGTTGTTIVFNVPRNDALAKADPATPDAARLWTGYLSGWTAWNHVRTVAALAAAAAFTAAL